MVKPSFLCTIYEFSCGEYDTTTGIPAKQYSPTTARVFVGPKGSAMKLLGTGYFPVQSAEGITSYDLDQGTIIQVKFQTGSEGYWQIMGRLEIPVGNVLSGYVLNLAKMLNLPFVPLATGTYGFETVTADSNGIVTDGFESGFERIIIV